VIDMTSWPELDMDVLDDIELDPANIRLEMPVDAPQPDIMRDLFVNGDAFSLVEGIIKVGYLTHETPIAVERDGRTFVVEGNRRIAALKAIQNPYLIPEYQARITALVSELGGRDALRVVRFKKAPNQDQANQLIAAIHTSNIRNRWKPARQAAFFQAQVDAGKTLPVLLEEYPMSSVRRFVRASQLLNKFKGVAYKDPSLSDYIREAKFPTSTLARIYESAEFNRVLSVDTRPDGSIRIGVTDARFRVIATRIIGGMKSNELTARTMPKTSSDKFVSLIRELQEIIDKPSQSTNQDNVDGQARGAASGSNSDNGGGGGSPSSANDLTRSAGAEGGGTPGASPNSADGRGEQVQPQPPQKRKSALRLDPHGLEVPPTYPLAIQKIFGELIEIHVQKYPNAVMDLLRTFLEKTSKAYARSQGHTLVPRNGVHVQLGDCLVWLNGHVRSLPDYSGLTSVINRIQSRNNKQYPTSAAYLNDINHNPDMHATPDDAHELWESMISLMRLMLK